MKYCWEETRIGSLNKKSGFCIIHMRTHECPGKIMERGEKSIQWNFKMAVVLYNYMSFNKRCRWRYK